MKPCRFQTLTDHLRRCELYGIPDDQKRDRFRGRGLRLSVKANAAAASRERGACTCDACGDLERAAADPLRSPLFKADKSIEDRARGATFVVTWGQGQVQARIVERRQRRLTARSLGGGHSARCLQHRGGEAHLA